jgi:hypothetical protein
LLVGISDLEQGIDWFERSTGVRAVKGGKHPGLGTRNALVSLGGRRYLELIAPDPAQSSYTFHIDVRVLTQPRIITWVAGVQSIDAIEKLALAAGQRFVGPSEGSRARPDGRALKWRVLRMVSPFGEGTVEPFPFFIEWAAGSVHPSEDSPPGCELVSFAVEHPDSEGLTSSLATFGIKATVTKSESARIEAVLGTPKGRVGLW